MSTYCTGRAKAKVTISNPYLVIGFDAPVSIETRNSITTFTHPMTSPIDQTFANAVFSVELSPPGQTYNNGAYNNPIRECPIPQINGKHIYSDFDNYYADNSGACSYLVTFFPGLIINGVFVLSNDGQYTVTCDDDCPPGQCKCATTNYPGYCCLPCSQVASEIASITAIARSKHE